MYILVDYLKVRHYGEVLYTLITPIRFLSSVNYLVYFKEEEAREVFSTMITAVLFFLSQPSFFICHW